MSNRRHFHTFDALRFFAFLKVFLLHLPIVAFPVFNYLKSGGGIGVDFFFVLSGFLITYIILEEKSLTGRLNLKNFFIRRILRIWPLFYLMILIAFLTPYLVSLIGLTSSPDGYRPNWLMSCFFLENYKMMFSHSEPNVSPLGVMWSLCVEEHFYIIWGVTLFFLPVKKAPYLIVGAFLVGNLTRAIYIQNGIGTADVFSNIDYFAWGAIPAFLLITRGERLTLWIEKIPIGYKIAIIFALLGYVILSPNIQYALKDNIEPIIFGMLFSSLLLIIIPEKNRIKIPDTNVLSQLGIFTYGLYVYHTIVLNFLNQLTKMVGFSLQNPLNAIVFSLVSLGVNIGVSMVSYYIFEKQFSKIETDFLLILKKLNPYFKDQMGNELTIKKAQQQVDDWIKTIGVRYFGELTNMVILTEEVGELARIIARKYGDQSFKPGETGDNIADEMADVLWVLICLANQTGIDLEEAFIRNIEKKTNRDFERHRDNPKLKS